MANSMVFGCVWPFKNNLLQYRFQRETRVQNFPWVTSKGEVWRNPFLVHVPGPQCLLLQSPSCWWEPPVFWLMVEKHVEHPPEKFMRSVGKFICNRKSDSKVVFHFQLEPLKTRSSAQFSLLLPPAWFVIAIPHHKRRGLLSQWASHWGHSCPAPSDGYAAWSSSCPGAYRAPLSQKKWPGPLGFCSEPWILTHTWPFS